MHTHDKNIEFVLFPLSPLFTRKKISLLSLINNIGEEKLLSMTLSTEQRKIFSFAFAFLSSCFFPQNNLLFTPKINLRHHFDWILIQRKESMELKLEINTTCEEIFVSSPFRPDSREPTMCIKVLVSKFNIKTMWLLNKTSKNAK